MLGQAESLGLHIKILYLTWENERICQDSEEMSNGLMKYLPVIDIQFTSQSKLPLFIHLLKKIYHI